MSNIIYFSLGTSFSIWLQRFSLQTNMQMMKHFVNCPNDLTWMILVMHLNILLQFCILLLSSSTTCLRHTYSPHLCPFHWYIIVCHCFKAVRACKIISWGTVRFLVMSVPLVLLSAHHGKSKSLPLKYIEKVLPLTVCSCYVWNHNSLASISH